MDIDFLIVNSFAFILLGIACLWLAWQQRKLKQENLTLMAQIESINKDLAGMCSAAVKVDARITRIDARMTALSEQLTHYQAQEANASPYHNVIQRVRDGANTDQLIKECGLSREEAALLFKLHGAGEPSE